MDATDLLDRARLAGLPVLLWGAPGVGKTALVRAWARARGLHLEAVLASIREPADFLGLPVVSGGSVRYEPPAWARRLSEAGEAVLFLDEISTAPPAVQSALLRVILERVVGELQLPDSVAMVAAANPPDQAAGGWELSPPLANRFMHVRYEPDVQAWAEGFPPYWGNPPALRVDAQRWALARSLVAAFITRRPSLLLRLPPEEERGGPWPSPRTWDGVSRVLALSLERPAEAAVAISGLVGTGAAQEFLAWAAEHDLPDPEELLRDPEHAALPQRGDRLHAALLAAASAALQPPDIERWRAAWRLAARAADVAIDVAASAARVLARAGRQYGWPAPKAAAVFMPLLSAAEGGRS